MLGSSENNAQNLFITKRHVQATRKGASKGHQELPLFIIRVNRDSETARSEPETMASRVEECPGYKTAIQRQPEINAKSAINQVQNIPEILEMILAETDMRTLLTSAQRVCRTWLNLISKSPSIQKALFFTPIKESEWGMKETIPNPLLAQTFPSFFPAKGRLEHYRFNFSDLVMTKDASTMARFVRDDASWRKMLVQQPPISDIGILHISHGKGGDSARSSNIPVSFQPTPRSDLKVSSG